MDTSEPIEDMLARLAPLIKAVDLDTDIDEELAEQIAQSEHSGTEFSEDLKKIWVLHHRRQIELLECRRLTGLVMQNKPLVRTTG